MHKEYGQSVTVGKYNMFPGHSLGKGATGTVYKGE